MKPLHSGIILLLVLTFSLGYGQKNYSDGYIITHQNDTIHGKVKDQFGVQLILASPKIKFIDSSGSIKKLRPRDIKGYSKAGIIDYVTIQENLSKNFARVVVDGDIKLLVIQKVSTYMTASPTGPGTAPGFRTQASTVYYLYQSNTSETQRVSALSFKKDMASYFADHDQLKNMILNKELRFKDLEIIVETYNEWKDQMASL